VGETARKYHATLYELVNGIPPWSLAKTKKMFKKHGLVMSKRSVWNLRQKYDALLKTSPANDPKILAVVQSQKYLVLDIFEVPSHGDWPPLWIVRDWFCGVILAAISVPDQQMAKLFEAIGKVRCECGVPVIGFISDGHPLIKNTILSFLSNKAENLSRYLELAEKTFKSWRDLPAFLESLTCLDEVLAKDLCPPRLWRTQ
jgi:hypothetical protein